MASPYFDPEDLDAEMFDGQQSPSAPPVPAPSYSGPLPTGYSQAEVDDFLSRNPGDSHRVMSALNDRQPQAAPSSSPQTFSFGSGAPSSIAPFTEKFQFDPTKLGQTDAFKFRFDKALGAIKKIGASRGTLLNPQTWKAMEEEASGLASQEVDAEYGRQHGEFLDRFGIHTTNEGSRYDSQRSNRLDDFGMFDTNRNFDRRALEGDRVYGRGVMESDRAFDYGRERDRTNDLFRFTDYGYNSSRYAR
jgi:hypothetical protein